VVGDLVRDLVRGSDRAVRQAHHTASSDSDLVGLRAPGSAAQGLPEQQIRSGRSGRLLRRLATDEHPDHLGLQPVDHDQAGHGEDHQESRERLAVLGGHHRHPPEARE
jgi:hypothetical protein